MTFMRSITKWFVGRPAAPAQRNYSSALQSVDVAIHIDNLKISVKFNGAVIVNRYSRFGHLAILLSTMSRKVH
jgi:hypothetical protein